MSSITFSLKLSESFSRLLIFEALSMSLFINLFIAILTKKLFKNQSDLNKIECSNKNSSSVIYNNKDFDTVIYYDEGIKKVRNV